ncbi:MAG: carboxypeptidase-like regulatory domain-containing protein [Dehalococcoidia bacterium]|jgi:hypothetical protein|nr:carboxypeptidase-like regulatory domain-containing protein [Dehalococcoidia bacterium]
MEVYQAGETVYWQFNTRDGDGAPITFAGSPAVAVRKDNGTTTDTDGVTLTVDSGSVTGLHTLSIDTSQDETFYATGHEFFVIVTSGTVDSTSVVGEVVHRFRLGEVPADVQAWDGGAVPSLTPLSSIADILEDTGTTLPAAIALLATAAALSALDGKVGGLNDLSAAEVNAEVDQALADYDGPTKAELDSGLSGLSIPTVTEINTELETEHGAGSWGAQGSYTITPTTPLTNSETGAAISGMIVKIYSDSARTEIITQETSDTEGSFTAHVTAPGTYYLRATKEGYQDLEWTEVAS